MVFGGQELLKFFPQVTPAFPRSAVGDQPREDQDGGDQQDETGVVEEGEVEVHGRGLWYGGSQSLDYEMGKNKVRPDGGGQS